MSYKIVQLVHGADPEKLRPAMKRFVLAVLAAHAKHDGTEVRPGLSRLARMCGLSIDAVYRWRRLLRVEGWIVQTRKATFKKPAVYRINIKKLQDAAWQGIRANPSVTDEGDSAPAQIGTLRQRREGIRASAERVSAAAQSPLSAPAQTEKSSTGQIDGQTEVRERVAPPSPSESSTQAEGESEADREDEDGWSLNERLKVVLDEVGEDALNPTDLSIANTIRSRSKSGLKISPALMANFIGIFSKALAISNSKREAS